MPSGGAWHLKSSTNLEYEKFQNVPLRKKSLSECTLEIGYHSDKESLELLLLSPYTSTSNSYKIHLTTVNLSKSDLNIKRKKSNKMVIDNKTNDSCFNESTNVLTTKPKNKHKDKSHKETRHCDAVNQSSFSKMDKGEGNLKTSFLLKEESEKYSHRKTHKHKKHHLESTDMEKEFKRDKKTQMVTNEDEDLMAYRKRKKFGVDKATDPLGYTANLIKNSQLCFVLSTGNNPFKADNNNESIIKVKGALINGKEKRSKRKEDVDDGDLKLQDSNETVGKRPKSDGISFFFKKKKLFSRSPSVNDEEGKTRVDSVESNEKTTRRKSKKRDELKSATMGKEKHKHHSKNRSLSADATANVYMDRDSVESKSHVGDAFKILKRSKKHNVSLNSEDTKREKVKTKGEKVKRHSHETDPNATEAKHNKKGDNECDTAWYKLRRKNKTRPNSLSGFEGKKEQDHSKEVKHKEKDGKSIITESIRKHHKSKKKRDKSKTNSLCVVTSETQIYSCVSDREKLYESLKTKKKVDAKIASTPTASYHKIKKGRKDKKENEKLDKHQTDTSEKKQRRHRDYKQVGELEDIISRGAKEIHAELQQDHHREHHHEHHHEHRKHSRNKSKHKSKSRNRSKNVKDNVSVSENEILKKIASDSTMLNKSSPEEYVISNSDYSVLLEKILSGKHSFKELTSAIEENHFFEALKSGSLLSPKQSSHLKDVGEEKKSYAVTKKQLEILINYLKSSMDVNKANSSGINVSKDKLTEVKLERQEISFSKLNLNPINQFYDRNCWDRFIPKYKRLKRRVPFDQNSILSDTITAKEKSQYGNRFCQNRTSRNFTYSESITERSNRSIRRDQKSALGFTVEGVEPPKKLRPNVSSVNLAKSNKDGSQPPSPDSSVVNLTKSYMKKPLQISVLSVLEIKPNFAEVFTKSNIKFECDSLAQPTEDMKGIKEEPIRESKSILKKASNTSAGKAISNVAISRKLSNASGCKLNAISSGVSQNKSRLSISESEKSVDLKGVFCGGQNQNSKTKFQVKSSCSVESRKKIEPSIFDCAGNKYPEDNRKALKKYSLLSEKCSLSEPRSVEVLNHDLDKDQLANLGQEVLEMMKKYINLSKNEDCPNMDLSSFGAEFLTNVRTCIHERLKPVKEELDMETKESDLPRTDSKNLTKRPSSTSRRIREDINKCVQNYLDTNSVASLNQNDLSQITSNVTKKVESFIKDNKKEKSPSRCKLTHKNSTSSKEGVRARMANYINTINEKRKGSSVTAVKSRERSLERPFIKRTLSILSRGSSRGSVNLQQSLHKPVSEKSLDDFSAARGSTSSGLSVLSRDDSITCSVSKKIEDINETLPIADVVTENVDVPDSKCSISSVLLPKIAEESPSQNSFGFNTSPKAGKQSNPPVKAASTKVSSKSRIASPVAKPIEDNNTKVATASDPLKRISESKVRRHISKNDLNEKLKLIAQDMSERVMKALKGSSEDGSVTLTGDDLSSAGSQFSEIVTNKVSNTINKIKESATSDSVRSPIMKSSKLKTTGVSEKHGSVPSLLPKAEPPSVLNNLKVGNSKKPIVKKKKKLSDSLSNFSHKGSELQLNLKDSDLTPLKSISNIDKVKQPNQEVLQQNNLQSTENVALLNELISKNIMNILGKNPQIPVVVNTTKEKAKKKEEEKVKKKEEEKTSPVQLVENEENDRKKKIINKLAAAILDDKIFGNLESQLSKLLDKESDQVVDSTKKVVVKEPTHQKPAQVVKKEVKKTVATKQVKPTEEEINKDEVSESHDPKKALTEKVSKIPRYTRYGTKSTTSHFGTSSEAGSNIGNIRPTALPKPLKKTTNTVRTESPSGANCVSQIPLSTKSNTPKEESGVRPLSTFEKRKLYAANMRAKKLASKSEAGFTADECTYGKPYEILYVTGEGPSVDPNNPLLKYIFDEPPASKKIKKKVNKDCEKKSSCTKLKAALSTEVTIQFTPSNNKLNISSNQHKIEQSSEFQIRSENNFLRDCDNDSNIFRNNYARRASSVSLYSEESRFSQEICMHCLTPKATLSLVSISTSNKKKIYSTRSNSILHIDGSDSSHEMVKNHRNKKLRRRVFNVTHFLGNNKEVLSAFLKTTEGSSNLSVKTSPSKLLTSKTDRSIKRTKSCGGFIGVWKKIETNHFHYKKPNASKSSTTFEGPHSSNYHPAPEIKIKKKINKFRKSMLVEVGESSICETRQEKPKKPKKKCNKKCPSAFNFQSSKCEYFKLHKPLVNLTRAIKKQNKVLCAKVNKLKSFHKSKKNVCYCKYEEGDQVGGCYTVFKNFHCSKIPRQYFSNENFQFFRRGSLTAVDTNCSTMSIQNSFDLEASQQKSLQQVPSKNNSVNAESGYETHSTKTVNSIRRFHSAEKNILSRFTSDFRYFDAGSSFPAVYTVFPVNTNDNRPKCCDRGRCSESSGQLNQKPQSPCSKFRLKQARSSDKGTSPKPNKVTFKKCIVESENFFCENQDTENCECKNCARKSSSNERNDKPRVLVCRNPKCPKNIQDLRKRSDGRTSDDEFTIIRCKNSNTSQSDTSSRSSNSQFTSINRQVSSSSTYSCGYSEATEINIKQSGSIKSGCIPKYIWCKVKNRENSSSKSTCSCGTTYQNFQKEKEQCKEYAQKVRKESSLRKEGRFKQFSDFKEIPLCVLLNSSSECHKDNCPKYNKDSGPKNNGRKSEDSPKLKVLDNDYQNTSESCMRQSCPRNTNTTLESSNLLNEKPRDSNPPELMDIPKNLNNLSKESLIDIINEQFKSSMKNILDNSKDRISVSSKEVSAQLIKPESSAMLKDTSVQAIAPLADKKSDDLVVISNNNQDPPENSMVNLVEDKLMTDNSINKLPSTSSSSPARSEHVESKSSFKNIMQTDNCTNSTCRNRKPTPTEPPIQVMERSNSVNIPQVGRKKISCPLKMTPSGKKDVNCHCLDFQNMPKSTLLKLQEQITECLTKGNDESEVEKKPRTSERSSFPFNENPVENQFSTSFMQTPVETSNLSKIPFGEFSLNTSFYAKQNSTDGNQTPVQVSNFSENPSHTLFLESYWDTKSYSMGPPEEIPKSLLARRNSIVSENFKSRGNFSSTEDIPSKEQSFKTPPKQQMLNNVYPEDGRNDTTNKMNDNFSIPNMLNNTLQELELINATKQSLELSSKKLSKQLKSLSIELLLHNTTKQEDSNNTQHENVILPKDPNQHLLNSSEEELDEPSTEAKSSSGTIKKSKGFPKDINRQTLEETESPNSLEVLTEANDRETKVSSKKSITSISSEFSQESSISQEITTMEEIVSVNDANSTQVEENCQTSNVTIKVSKETSTIPIDTLILTISSKGVDTGSSEVEEIVNYQNQVIDFTNIANQSSSTIFSNQLSSEVVTSNFVKKEDSDIKETVQENAQNFKDSLLSLMDLIEIKSDELLSLSQESLVISLDEITMMNESTLSSEDLSNKLGVLFKTSVVKLLDMKSEYLTKSMLQETFRNTVEVLLNDIFDEASNQVVQSDLDTKTEKHFDSDLYQGMLCDFMKESDENPFERPIDTISKVAIVMLVQNISCVQSKRQNKAIPDKLLMEMAQVSLQAIMELYQKMYSKKEVNVSFQVMVEEMCKNQSLNKKMEQSLTGSQLEIINILNKKYVSESNTTNYKNCFCSPIEDMPSTTPAARKTEAVRIASSSKLTVKSQKPELGKLREQKDQVEVTGSSKFTVKGKEESDGQKNVHELKKLREPLKNQKQVTKTGSLKFIAKSKEAEQQNDVHGLEKLQDKLTNKKQVMKTGSSKFTVTDKEADRKNDKHEQEKLQEQLSNKKQVMKTGSSKFIAKGKEAEQQNDVHQPEELRKRLTDKEEVVIKGSSKFPTKGKEAPLRKNNAQELAESREPLKKQARVVKTGSLQFIAKNEEAEQQVGIHERQELREQLSDKEKIALKDSIKFSTKGKEAPHRKNNAQELAESREPLKKQARAIKTGSLQFIAKNKEAEQQVGIHEHKELREQLLDKEKIALKENIKFPTKGKEAPHHKNNAQELAELGEPLKKQAQVIKTGSVEFIAKNKEAEIHERKELREQLPDKGKIAIEDSSKFPTKGKEKPDQKNNVHELKELRERLTAKEEVAVKGSLKLPAKSKEKPDQEINVPKLEELQKPLKKQEQAIKADKLKSTAKGKEADHQNDIHELREQLTDNGEVGIKDSKKLSVKSKEKPDQKNNDQDLEKLRNQEQAIKAASSKFPAKEKENSDQKNDVQDLEKLRNQEQAIKASSSKFPTKEKQKSDQKNDVQDLEKLRNQEQAIKAASSKFPAKGKDNSDQKNDVDELGELRQPFRHQEQVTKAESSKFIIKDKQADHKLEELRQRSTNQEEDLMKDGTKFPTKDQKKPDPKNNVQELEELRKKLRSQEEAIKAASLEFTAKSQRADRQNDVHKLKEFPKQLTDKEPVATTLGAKFPVKSKKQPDQENNVTEAGSSKFTMKSKETDQQSDGKKLEELREQLTDKEEVKLKGSSKPSAKDRENPKQQTNAQELEKLQKQLQNQEQATSKFTILGQEPDHELDELRKQLRNNEQVKKSGGSKTTSKSKEEPVKQNNVHALEKLRQQLTDKEMFEKLLNTYENEEKIVERLSKDDIFFQSQLELVKSKESIESMFKNISRPSSSSNMLDKSMPEKNFYPPIESNYSSPNSENVSPYFAKESESVEMNNIYGNVQLDDSRSDINPAKSKKKIKNSLHKLKKLSKNSIRNSTSSNEKILYKYDFDAMVSTYEDSQTSKSSIPINPKGDLTKSNKSSSRSRLSSLKAKVGNMFKKESEVKEIVAPRRESNRGSINESYLSKSKTSREVNDDEQTVKFGDMKYGTPRKSPIQDDIFEIHDHIPKAEGSISSIGSYKLNPSEIGKCFLKGFRPDNITLSGVTCLNISGQEEEQRKRSPQLYRSPSINFSERETPLDFLLALGFSIDEASNAIKDEDVKNRLLAAITEARIWINKITSVQGTLLYLISYKAKPKVMRYFLQLVEAIINKRINDAVKLDAFLRILEKVEDGDLAMMAILGSEKFVDDDNDEKMVKKQLREIFITVYKIAETESNLKNKPLSSSAINLLRILAAKYRAGLNPHLELIAKYIGQGLMRSEVQLEAAMIYLARLDTAYVNLEEFEEYIAIHCPQKKP